MAIKKLEGTLLYVQVQKPVNCYEKEKGQEWKMSIAVDEDASDEWDEAYPKQTAKRVKTVDFETQYKFEPPFPGQKKQCVITLRKNTLLANGEPVPELYTPKVLLKSESGNTDITQESLVGNGSKGMVSIDHYDAKLGPVARLKNILVLDLIEYIKPDEFGDDPVEKSQAKPAEAAKTEVVVKTSGLKTVKPTPPVEEDEDVPF